MKTKKCNKCGETKAVDDYTKHTNSKDGLRHSCKRCRTTQVRNWRNTGSTTKGGMDDWTTPQLLLLRNEVDYILTQRGEHL